MLNSVQELEILGNTPVSDREEVLGAWDFKHGLNEQMT